MTVIGLICFGILHNVFELRYVLGRFADLLGGPVGVLVLVLITGIAVLRLGGGLLGSVAVPAEIILGYGVLGAGVWLGLRRWWRALGWAVLVGAAAASLTHPAYHVVVLAHLHNLVPLVFLWEWSRRLVPGPRRVFRGVQLGWVLVVPGLVLAGAVDAVIGSAPGVVGPLVGDGSGVVAAVAWPGEPAQGLRWLVAFAFLQTMHYVVWVWFLPRAAPQVSAAVEARWPVVQAPRLRLAALGLAVGLAMVLVLDYGQGRTVYSGLAAYHAYLEFPIVLALLAGGTGWRP